MERYSFFIYNTGEGDSDSGVTFQQTNGFGEPIGGVVFAGHRPGWFCTPPDEGSRSIIYPPSDELDADEAEKLFSAAEKAALKLRRRIEDSLRKGGIEFLLRQGMIPNPAFNIFT